MKKTYCDICKKEFDEEYQEVEFASIEGKELRFFSDGDICDDCWKKMQKFVYSAIKTHVFNNIKILGNFKERKEEKWN